MESEPPRSHENDELDEEYSQEELDERCKAILASIDEDLGKLFTRITAQDVNEISERLRAEILNSLNEIHIRIERWLRRDASS
jgi:hypothetical protein